MVRFKLLAVIVAFALSACTGKAVDRPSVIPVPDDRTEAVTQPCPNSGRDADGARPSVAAVFVFGKALYGIDDQMETARELVHYKQPVDFAVLSAQFTGDGESLLIHRDWEGRDSWWASRSDGTDLRRLSLPVGYQLERTFRRCQDAFVGALKDGRFVRFNLHGSTTYWTPESNDRRVTDTAVLSSPGTNLVAYVSQSGVVILGDRGTGLSVHGRTQGRRIYGWLGANQLITGDANAFYVFDVQNGEASKVDLSAVFTGGPWMTTVSGHETSPFLYVVGSSAPPDASHEVVAVNVKTLHRQPSLPGTVPESVMGAPQFSPIGRYEVWPVAPPRDRNYAHTVVLVQAKTRSVVHRTDLDMASLPFSFHPRDEGFVYTDLSKEDTRLMFQDADGRQTELMQAPAGRPFTAFDWNPVLGSRQARP